MLQLKTIRRPRAFWPGGARTAQQEEIRLLAGLSARVMHLQEPPLARKTLDTAMRGELW